MADSGWFALAGALGGVVLTGTIGLVSAMLNHRWNEQSRDRAARAEQDRILREQRREAFHRYLVTANAFYQAADQAHRMASRGEEFDAREHMRGVMTALQDTYIVLTISAGEAVRDRARAYNRALYDMDAAAGGDEQAWERAETLAFETRDRLRAAMRVELGVPD